MEKEFEAFFHSLKLKRCVQLQLERNGDSVVYVVCLFKLICLPDDLSFASRASILSLSHLLLLVVLTPTQESPSDRNKPMYDGDTQSHIVPERAP